MRDAKDVSDETVVPWLLSGDPSIRWQVLHLSTLAPGADLRNAFGLDSLDFVELVDRLSTRTGFRIEEDDADGLRSVEAVTQFLVSRSDHVGQQA